MKGSVSFTPCRMSLGPWAECQGVIKDSVPMRVPLPSYSPRIPKYMLLRCEPQLGPGSQDGGTAVCCPQVLRDPASRGSIDRPELESAAPRDKQEAARGVTGCTF